MMKMTEVADASTDESKAPDDPNSWVTDGPPCERRDPGPGRRASNDVALGGLLKVRPEDFLVDELPSYDPVGEGEHLYLGVQKRDMPHGEMIAVIARLFNIDESAIGFAGMKDRVAITRQAVSVHLPGFKGDAPPLDHTRMQVLWAKRHVNKLRRGHLKGNRFSIRVRDVNPLSVRHVYKRMQAMEKTGVPAYFGEQRFGYRRNNQVCGLAILASQPQVLLDEMLGSRGAPFPARQLPFRRLYEEGKFAESLVGWGRNDRAEKIALQALSKGRDAHRAVRALPEYIKSFWISALQSAIFNANLDARVADGSYAQMIDGDIMFKHDSGACFRASDASADEIAARLISAEISPTGPLHGIGMLQPTGRALDIETLALTAVGTTHEAFLAKCPIEFSGVRRPLRVFFANWEVEGGVDEHGAFIRCAFDLPKGAFATVLMRELLGATVPSIDGQHADTESA